MATAVAKRENRPAKMWDPMQSIREEVENFWSNFVGDRLPARMGQIGLPALDLSETANAVTVRTDLPGVNPKDIDIQLTNNVLTISGERREEEESKGETFHRIERRYGAYSRSVTLPAAVAEDKVEAQYKDGVLTITLPKTDEAKARRIKVKS